MRRPELGVASTLLAVALAAACGEDGGGSSGSGGSRAEGGASTGGSKTQGGSPSGGFKAQGGASTGGASSERGGATGSGGVSVAGGPGAGAPSAGADAGGSPGTGGDGGAGNPSMQAGAGGEAGAGPVDPCARLVAVGSCDQREGDPPGTCYEFHDPPFQPDSVPCPDGILLESGCPAGDDLTGYCLGAVLGRSEYYYGDSAIEGQSDCLDSGGDWCPRSCAGIEESYAETLAAAQACNPTVGAAQCTLTRSDGPGCGCPVRVNDTPASADLIAELARLTQAYADAGCDLNACPDPEDCVPVDSFGCRGTSVSDSVCAPPP